MSAMVTTPWDAEIVRLGAIKARSFRETIDLVDLQGRVQGYLRAKAEQLEKEVEEAAKKLTPP